MTTTLAQLRDLICENFNRDEIERVLYDEMNLRLEDLVLPDDNYVQVLFKLEKTGRSHGWYPQFLEYLAAERRNKAAFVAAINDVVNDIKDEGGGTGNGGKPSASIWRIFRDFRDIVWFYKKEIALIVLLVFAAWWVFLGWVPVSTKILLETRSKQSVHEGRNVATASNIEWRTAPPGYGLTHRGLRYGVNMNGEAHIVVAPFFWGLAWLSDNLAVGVGSGTGDDQRVLRLRTQPARLEIKLGLTAPDIPAGEGGLSMREGPVSQQTASAGWAVATANAAPRPFAGGTRLFIQSVTVPASANAETMQATLSSGQQRLSLRTLSADLRSDSDSPLPVKSGAPLVLNYQYFFRLQAGPPKDATITLRSPSFFAGYSEVFSLPDDLELGRPTSVPGKNGGALVVQLTRSIDVVFFERLATLSITPKLVPLAAAAGFVPRVNPRSSDDGSAYNVVYSGKDVPTADLQALMKILLEANVGIKLIQPQLTLSNGIQYQVQVGSNDRVTCLQPINSSQVAQLLGTSAQFDSAIKQLRQAYNTSKCST